MSKRHCSHYMIISNQWNVWKKTLLVALLHRLLQMVRGTKLPPFEGRRSSGRVRSLISHLPKHEKVPAATLPEPIKDPTKHGKSRSKSLERTRIEEWRASQSPALLIAGTGRRGVGRKGMVPNVENLRPKHFSILQMFVELAEPLPWPRTVHDPFLHPKAARILGHSAQTTSFVG